MHYGLRIKEARTRKKITQTDLAEMVGVTRQTIGLLEAGRYNPSLKLCVDLAIALDKTLDDIFWFGGHMRTIMQYKHILITDIGSTTTKALLLSQIDEKFHFIGEVNVPTTVESPYENVGYGIFNAAEKLQEKTGVKLVSPDGKLKIPYITTSSAGGGLQILVFGLSKTETGKVAEMTAMNAGGVILHTFTIDDDIDAIQKMRMIKDLHPDMILMAGGVDGGNIAGPVRLAEILSLSKPTGKFHQKEKIPLVYCGNTDAQRFITNILQKNFEMYIVENIRPDLTQMNPKPAKEKIHDLFMENVMERAPGYGEVKKIVKKNILPTPSSIEKILGIYSQSSKKNLVMVDIGGATTDIFSNIYENFSRTVAANTGMSYSISNVMAESGIDAIFDNLPDIENCNKNDREAEIFVRNYISNKMLNPTYIPTYDCEKLIEHAAAICGINIAWDRHKELNFQVAHLGFLDRMKRRVDVDHFQEVFYGKDTTQIFQVSDIDILIGSGGVLSHADTQDDAFRILTDGFLPVGITKLTVDRSFKSPHLGVLSTLDEDVALDLFKDECLMDIGYVIAPTGKMDPKKTILTIDDLSSEISYSIKGGEVLYIPNGGDITISTSKNIRIFKDMKEIELKTKLPILFDCRGRGDEFNNKRLIKYNIPAFTKVFTELQTNIQKSDHEINIGDFDLQRELPYSGKIFVSTGENVLEDNVIGENILTPPKIYIIDVNNLVGYDKRLNKRQIREGLLVKVGDKINHHSKIFKIPGGLLGDNYFYSTVRGVIIQIESGGLIIIRELQDYSTKPVTINIAEKLNIKAKHIRNYIDFNIGDFIEFGQKLANYADGYSILKSPATGILKEIDTTHGTITIQYDLKQIPLKAFVRGVIDDVTINTSAELHFSGAILNGAIGFGKENFGQLVRFDSADNLESMTSQIGVTYSPIDIETLKNAAKYGVSGIIAPSIDNLDWVEYYGKEIGVALTGEEDIPFSILLTEGFGQHHMNKKYHDFLEEKMGRIISISGRTQIRAGVLRPKIFISN